MIPPTKLGPTMTVGAKEGAVTVVNVIMLVCVLLLYQMLVATMMCAVVCVLLLYQMLVVCVLL